MESPGAEVSAFGKTALDVSTILRPVGTDAVRSEGCGRTVSWRLVADHDLATSLGDGVAASVGWVHRAGVPPGGLSDEEQGLG